MSYKKKRIISRIQKTHFNENQFDVGRCQLYYLAIDAELQCKNLQIHKKI